MKRVKRVKREFCQGQGLKREAGEAGEAGIVSVKREAGLLRIVENRPGACTGVRFGRGSLRAEDRFGRVPLRQRTASPDVGRGPFRHRTT